MKYKIRRAIIMALADCGNICHINRLLNHPQLTALNVEAEAIRDQAKLLVKHGYLLKKSVNFAVVALSTREVTSLRQTSLPSHDEFLWGSIVAERP